MRQLRPYQQEAVDLLVPAGRGVYGDGTGSGKTVGATEMIRQWGGRTLVVTPYLSGAGIRRWQDELNAAGIPFETMIGTPKRRAKAVEDFNYWSKDVLLTHYDFLRSDVEQLRPLGFETLVLDEAHRIKKHNGKTTKAAFKIAAHCDHVLACTATKVMNGPADMWSLLHLLWPDRYSSYWRWVDQHCTTRTTDFHGTLQHPIKLIEGLRPGADEWINEALDGYIIERDDLLSLDEPQQQVLTVTLSSKERALYRQLERHSFADIDGELLIAMNAAVLTTRLRQITSDWSQLCDSEGPGSKVKATAELISDLGEPVVVMCGYKATCDRLVELLLSKKILAARHHGDMAPAIRQAARDAFVDGDQTVLVGTQASLGEGIDGLQHRARILIMLDREWNPARNTQAIGRLQRDGQTKPVIVYHIVAEDSTDQKVAEALVAKTEVADALRGYSLALGTA